MSSNRRDEPEWHPGLAEVSPLPVVVYGPDRTLRYANEVAAEFANAPDRDALAGRRVTDLAHPADRDAMAREVDRVLEDRERSQRSELRVVATDGEQKHALVANAPVVYDGERAGQAVLADVTEQKRTERRLRRRTERLDSVAGMVSHDLRSPLATASVGVELARMDCDCEYIDHIERAHGRMNDLIDDVVAVARDDRKGVAYGSIDLAATVEECWSSLDAPDARLVTQTDQNIVGDRRRVRQLLENLLRNAVEHGSTSNRSGGSGDAVEHGSPSSRPGADDAVGHGGDGVTVRVGDLEDGFYVADDGAGIPADERERVFERGYSTDPGAAGVGLDVVRRVAGDHGWNVELVESDDGGVRVDVTGVDSPG